MQFAGRWLLDILDQRSGKDQDEAKQSPWARFITEAKQLRIVWTESKKFRAPVTCLQVF